jgi:large repetitive protein
VINILVKKSQPILVPTAFTPNEDGENDHLLVHGKAGIKVKNFRIYDRWGELIFQSSDFESNDPKGGWDGTFRQKNMPVGTYPWAVEVMYIDGSVELFKGETELLR